MLVEMSARMRQKIDTLDWRIIWIHNLNWEHSLSQYSFQVWFPATLVTRSLEEKFDTYKSLRELRRIDFRLMKSILCLSGRLSNFLSRKSSQAKRFVISMYELSFVEKQWHVLLRLNDSKTEFMIVGTRQQLAKVNIDQLCVGESSIVPVTSVKNLGSWFDKNMSMTTHIIKVCKAASFHLYNIRRIRKYLTSESTHCLVRATVIGRIDYCNSLLFKIPAVHIAKLQRIQNSAARLVYYIPRFEHITPVLHRLLWLPVSFSFFKERDVWSTSRKKKMKMKINSQCQYTSRDSWNSVM